MASLSKLVHQILVTPLLDAENARLLIDKALEPPELP